MIKKLSSDKYFRSKINAVPQDSGVPNFRVWAPEVAKVVTFYAYKMLSVNVPLYRFTFILMATAKPMPNSN